MGEVLAAVATFEKAKQAYDGARGGQEYANAVPTGAEMPQGAPMPDYGSQGQSQAAPQGGPIQTPMQSLDQSAISMPSQEQIAPAADAPSGFQGMVGNLFAGKFDGANTNSEYAANRIAPTAADASVPQGAPQAPQQAPSDVGAPQAPQTAPQAPQDQGQQAPQDQGQQASVTGQQWQPHKETLLGKIGDALLMMKGMNPVFRQRTAEANQRDVMQQYYKQMGTHPTGQQLNDLNNDTARRLDSIPGLDPKVAEDFTGGNSRDAYYDSMSGYRQDQSANIGMSRMSSIATTITNMKNPDGTPDIAGQSMAYDKLRPVMQTIGSSAGIDDNRLSTMLPDKYDPTVLGGVAKMGESSYDQFKEGYDQNRATSQDTYRQAQLTNDDRNYELKVGDQKIALARTGIAAQNAQARIAGLNQNQLYRRQSVMQRMLPPALQGTWVGHGLMSGTYEPDTGIPVPGKLYVAPDKSGGVQMNADGTWDAYKITNIDRKHGKVTKQFLYKLPAGNYRGQPTAMVNGFNPPADDGSDDFSDN